MQMYLLLKKVVFWIISLGLVGFFILVLDFLVSWVDSFLIFMDLVGVYFDIVVVEWVQQYWIMFFFIVDFFFGDCFLGEKVVVINVLGWNIDGSNNVEQFFVVLVRKNDKFFIYMDLGDLILEELFIVGYFLVLDDY